MQALPGAEALVRFGKPSKSSHKEGEEKVADGGFVRPSNQLNPKRLIALAKDKLPSDSSEVATDEGDDRDFQEEMARIQWKPIVDRKSASEESGEVDDEEAPERPAEQHLPPPPRMQQARPQAHQQQITQYVTLDPNK